MFQQISAPAAQQLIRDQSPVIFDVRDAIAYSDARLPNAIHVTPAAIKAAVKGYRRDTPLLIYCYRGHSSREYAQLFTECGFLQVYSLEGGFHNWHAIGGAIERPAKSPAVVHMNPVDDWLAKHGGTPDDPNAPLPCGTPPLIKACQNGLADIARILIKAGARLDRTDRYGNDALWAACYSGDLRTIAVLMEAGADLNRRNPSGATSLIYAASAGKTEVVAFLLEAGADSDLKTEDDFTALELAANIEILRLLRHSRRPGTGMPPRQTGQPSLHP